MVTLNEELTIASAADALWPLLRDPAVVAGCIPGAQLSADSEDAIWRGSIRVKFGPTVALFRGEATIEFDDAAQRMTIDGRGIDGRGASRALANSVVELHTVDASSTTMTVAGEFTVTGPLEPFVNAGGVHVARALLSEFCNNIAAAVDVLADPPDANTQDSSAPSAITAAQTVSPTVEQSATPAAPAEADDPSTAVRSTPPLQAATELSAGALLWRALCSWLKNLFAKGNNTP